MKARFIRAAAAAALLLAPALVPVQSAETSGTTAAVKDDARTAGHAVAHGATTVGHSIAEGARHLGRTVRDGLERLKAGMTGRSGEPKS
jgi:hypothetical protein